MKQVAAIWLLLLVTLTPALADSRTETIAWIDSVGGTHVSNQSGDVTTVDLTSAWITDADLGRLSGLTQLENLSLSYTKITDLALERLVPLENVKTLELY